MSRKKIIRACVVAAAIAGLVAIAWLVCWPRGLPQVDEVNEMTAEVFDVATDKRVEFVVPPENWQSVLDALQPAESDPRPANWQVMGTLTVNQNLQTQSVIRLFDIPSGSGGKSQAGAFALHSWLWGRDYYRGGSSARLREALMKAYKDSQKADEEASKSGESAP